VLDHLFTIAVGKESEMSDLDETAREHMKEEPVDELRRLQGQLLRLIVVLRVSPPEADATILTDLASDRWKSQLGGCIAPVIAVHAGGRQKEAWRSSVMNDLLSVVQCFQTANQYRRWVCRVAA
jgi:hypothetical protein